MRSGLVLSPGQTDFASIVLPAAWYAVGNAAGWVHLSYERWHHSGRALEDADVLSQEVCLPHEGCGMQV